MRPRIAPPTIHAFAATSLLVYISALALGCLLGCASSSPNGADAGASAAADNQQRAEAVCDSALSALDDHREGFCALASIVGEDEGDAGTGATTCAACAAGADDSQAAQARTTCTESAVDCPDLSVADVEACLEVAAPVFDAQLPTCEEAEEAGITAAFGFLAALSTLNECQEFLGCGDLLTNLTAQ